MRIAIGSALWIEEEKGQHQWNEQVAVLVAAE